VIILFAREITEKDQPNNLVKILKYTEYVIKCPPYVQVSKGVSKLPTEMASIRNLDE
jgi:hypothetical protein